MSERAWTNDDEERARKRAALERDEKYVAGYNDALEAVAKWLAKESKFAKAAGDEGASKWASTYAVHVLTMKKP